MVSVTIPLSFMPWNGVFIPFDSKAVLSTVQVAFGSNIVMSASDPSFKVPAFFMFRIFAGFAVIFAMAWGRVRTFVFTRFVMMSESIVSNPTIPKGAD